MAPVDALGLWDSFETINMQDKGYCEEATGSDGDRGVTCVRSANKGDGNGPGVLVRPLTIDREMMVSRRYMRVLLGTAVREERDTEMTPERQTPFIRLSEGRC